jgi:hypothetical protein
MSLGTVGTLKSPSSWSVIHASIRMNLELLEKDDGIFLDNVRTYVFPLCDEKDLRSLAKKKQGRKDPGIRHSDDNLDTRTSLKLCSSSVYCFYSADNIRWKQ